MTVAKPAYAAAHFGLEIDGCKDIGFVKSLEGGNVKTDLIKYQNGASHPTFLRIGRPKYDDIKFQVGMSMSQGIYDWMKGFFSGDVQRHSGSMIAADFNLCEKARRNFDHAMITEIAFPKLDGGDKGSCYMNVTLCAETVTYQEGKNEKLKENLKQAQKSWSPCNFSFSIDGFEDACRRVTKVDGFSIKQKPIDYAHGNLRAGLKMAGRVEIPNISFYLPEADAQPFIKHHEKFVIGGSAEQPQLKGTIECYDHWGMQNKGGAIFWIDFMDATLFAVTHDKSDAGGEDIKQVKVELGVEKMDFFYPLMELQ
jgi:hypothetical protein